jgi:hypothetical protein
MLLREEYTEAGIIPPEIMGHDKAIYEKVVAQLREHDIIIEHRMDTIQSN